MRNVVTVYPKKTGTQSFQWVQTGYETYSRIKMDSYYPQAATFFDEQKHYSVSGIDIERFVKNHDKDHMDYHKDGFHPAERHYHAQFKTPIDEKKLDNILTVFVSFKLISKQEKTSFMTAYQQANKLEDEMVPANTEQSLNKSPTASTSTSSALNEGSFFKSKTDKQADSNQVVVSNHLK